MDQLDQLDQINDFNDFDPLEPSDLLVSPPPPPLDALALPPLATDPSKEALFEAIRGWVKLHRYTFTIRRSKRLESRCSKIYWVGPQHGAALGRHDGSGVADARGPVGLGLVSVHCINLCADAQLIVNIICSWWCKAGDEIRFMSRLYLVLIWSTIRPDSRNAQLFRCQLVISFHEFCLILRQK
jgi:hypothetical protein